MISVCAYCRVSTDSKDQANSFENQKSYFQRELSRHPNYQLFGIYADRGITGTKLHREKFDEMLIDAGLDIVKVSNNSGHIKYITMPSDREPKFNYIFVKNSSRFARNVEVETIFRDLAKKGVYVHFLDLNKSTENEADRTYIQIFCSFDERESRDRRKKVLFGIAEGNEKGVVRTNSRLYGYRYIRDENRLEIIESEARVVRLIFSLYIEGFGIRQILNKLDEQGIKTRNGKRFCKNSVNRILDNEKYFGASNNCKYTLGDDLFDKYTTPKRKADGDYTLTISPKIPPIIDEATFYKAKEIRQSKVNYQTQKGIRRGTTRYSGMIICRNCGQFYTSNVDRGRHFYNCKTKKNRGTTHCSNPNVSLNQIEEAISQFFEHSSKISQATIAKNLNLWYALGRYIIEQEPCNDEKIDSLRNDEQNLLSQLDNLFELYAIKKGNPEFLQKKIEKIERELQKVQAQIAELASEDNATISKIRLIQEKIDGIKRIKSHYETIEELIDDIVLYIGCEGKIDVCFKHFNETYKEIIAQYAEKVENVAESRIFGNLLEPELNERIFTEFARRHEIVL